MSRLALALLVCGGCRGAAVDVELFSREPLTLRSLRLETPSATLDLPGDGGPIDLPATIRLLVDGEPFDLQSAGVDVQGRGYRQRTAIAPKGPVTSVRVELADGVACPAPEPLATQTVLFDEGVRGRVVFGYDGSRLSQPSDASRACTGERFIQYESRGRYDGLGISAANPSRPSSLEVRWTASVASSWLVGFGDAQTVWWLPSPETCASDRAACLQRVDEQWRSVVFDVPASLGPTERIVFQLDSDASTPTLRLDDLRVTVR